VQEYAQHHGVRRPAVHIAHQRAEVYAGAPQASSAAQFGTLGINFRARKARDETEWANAVATLMCEL
jgi:hypothetical protein